MLIALIAAAFDLRTPIAAVSSILQPIARALDLLGWSISMLTTLPTLCLGAFAFLGPGLHRRVGDERVMAGCMTAIVVGELLRIVPSAATVFGGTFLVAAGIGLSNVTVPSLVKRDFTDRFATVTGLYAAVMALGAAGAAAGVGQLFVHNDPGRQGWVAPLALVTLPVAVIALLAWLPLALTSVRSASPEYPAGLSASNASGLPAAIDAEGRALTSTPEQGARRLRRDPVAWSVTMFFGTTTLLAYFVLGWLPTLITDQGVVRDGGLVLGASTLVQVAGALTGPLLYRRSTDLRGIGVAAAGFTFIGLAGVTFSPSVILVWVSALVLGYAQGVAFTVGLSLIGLRSPTAATAIALSAMAQGVGYLIGATGPLGAGLLYTLSGTWTTPVIVLLAAAAVQSIAATAAGRDRLVSARTDDSQSTHNLAKRTAGPQE